MQELPILDQFLAMDLGPGLDESLLGPRQIAANAFDRVKSEHGLGALIRSMKVRSVVRGADFHEHPNDYSEEPRNLRHRSVHDLIARWRAN